MYLVVQFHSDTQMVDMTRGVLGQLDSSPINSAYGIKLTLDNFLGNHTCLNITRPAVVGQYFGRESILQNNQNDVLIFYTYGSVSGTSSVKMDP